MTLAITKRDKMLLYIMGFVLIGFFFGWFIIVPQIDKADEIKAEIEILQTEKALMEMAIESLDSVAESYQEAEKEASQLMSNFYPYMQNYKIDKLMIDILQSKHGLAIESLKMSDRATGIVLKPYIYSFIEQQSIDAQQMPILTSTITVIASGTQADIQNAINDLFVNYPAIRVTHYSYSNSQEKNNVNLTLEIYMAKA